MLFYNFQRRLKNPKQLTSEEKIVYKELRRQSHISAEQKRRGSIKVGGRTSDVKRRGSIKMGGRTSNVLLLGAVLRLAWGLY